MIFGIFDQHLRIKQALFLTFDNELKIALVVVQAKLLSKCTIRTWLLFKSINEYNILLGERCTECSKALLKREIMVYHVLVVPICPACLN